MILADRPATFRGSTRMWNFYTQILIAKLYQFVGAILSRRIKRGYHDRTNNLSGGAVSDSLS